MYDRVFDAKDKYSDGRTYIPFVWSLDKTVSYEKFVDCYTTYIERARHDESMNINKLFLTEH